MTLARLHFLDVYIPHNRPRAIVGTACQLFDTTISFGIAYLLLDAFAAAEGVFSGDTPMQGSVVTPLYYSFGVLMNLGVENLHPVHATAQAAAAFEHAIGLLFLVVIFQNAVNSPAVRSGSDAVTPPTRETGPRTLSGATYAAFLDTFRHPPPFVEHLFARFADYFASSSPILDVGSGRGEFLEVMRRAGIQAYGVDVNPVLVQRCRAAGLQVVEGDWLAHMSSLQDASLGGIFSAQFVEHMSCDDLVRFLRLAHQKLRPGGRMAIETLNPCVNTLMEKFFVDPTHEFPLHPDVLRFFVATSGFLDVSVAFYNPPAESSMLLTVPAGPETETINRNFALLNRLIFAPHYYCVTARTPEI
ncbi:MAG: class I SAM-dependent methyltransferase [Vicinamibacterales bacterium]